MRTISAGESGQASVFVVGLILVLLVAAVVLGAIGRGVGGQNDAQRTADLAALAAGRAMHAAYPRLFVPARSRGRANPRFLTRAGYLAIARDAASKTATANGAVVEAVAFPDGDSMAPLHVRVRIRAGMPNDIPLVADAEAEIVPATTGGLAGMATGGGYNGPLAYRQGKPMRPDVALAFDRLEAAARADGVALVITSAYRSDAEQAILFARNPDPKWVAPPGKSLHRLGTELDLGPPGAYGWLAANAPRFGFVKRYSWEAWHFGYVANARSRPDASAARPDAGGRGDGEGTAAVSGSGSMPAFVPARFAPLIARAAQRWNVSATLLSAQLYAESNFNPFGVSPVGAAGIAQFMPGTAAAYGLRNRFDPAASIDAQAHLMHDLLRQFAAVPLALAAYNAGPRPVAACMCIPPFPETQAYVARILGLMGGAGDVLGGAAGFTVRLVE